MLELTVQYRCEYFIFCVGRMEFDETGRPTSDQIFLSFMGFFFSKKLAKFRLGVGCQRRECLKAISSQTTIRTNGKSKALKVFKKWIGLHQDLTITINPPQENIVCDGLHPKNN